MEFTLHTFLFAFLPLILIGFLFIYRVENQKVQKGYLLIVSLLIYAWACFQFLLWFLAIILLTYLLGNMVNAAKTDISEQQKWMMMAASIFVLILGYYKYYGFIMENLRVAGLVQDGIKDIVAPIGISFLIFEAISYVIDIKRGDASPGSLCDVALYLALFPKLVSGPIVLWKHFEPQIRSKKVDLISLTNGIDRIIVGYAKKVIIADSLGTVIALIQSEVSTGIDQITYFIWALLYMLEIYFDFSGYSDIAIGICRFFGFEIEENFDYPYTSISITEFWRKWHISLGAWFREYVYIPLGGNRKGNVYLNLFMVFLLTGIWHGANWTFLIWGGINGGLVVFERAIGKVSLYRKVPKMVKWLVTMMLVYLMWILFMSNDVFEAVDIYGHMLGIIKTETVNFTYRYFMTNKTLCIVLIGSALAVFGTSRKVKEAGDVLMRWHIGNSSVGDIAKSILLLILFLMSVLFVVNSSYSPFLYFQF